jgi:DNA-binding helix-hairpin-helix protein with protein kinase domain
MQVLRYLPNQKIVHLNLTVSLGRGGEACIYTVPTDANAVAKVYHKPSEVQARKLEVMLNHPPENPTASLGHISIAWPTELLRAADGSDRIVGFLMPRIRGMRPIIDFYNPRTRRQHCPLFSYQYLLRTARNLAAAFAALHASGYCVGDVNESNILVSDTALVTVVDTDSFQVYDPDNDFVHRCPVGKPEFTPPELQNKTFAKCDRAVPHDLFGLAVLIFQLLMEGTHPFSGIYQGAGEPPPYEARIAAGHFTYSQNRSVPYVPTPIAPPWKILHPSLQELFLRCFEDGHSNPLLRPSAQSWVLALAEAEDALVSCSTNPQHRYSSHLEICPWCERSLRLGGRDPFPSPQVIATREHLKPRITTRRRTSDTRRFPQTAAVSFQQHNYYTPIPPRKVRVYKASNKAGLYSVIFALLGIGTFFYLDLTNDLTSSYLRKDSLAQQSLIESRDNHLNLSFADYYKQGHAAYKVKKYDQAIENFTLAIKKQPQHAKAFVNRGNSHYNLKDYDAAIADYNQAIKINPKEVKAYVNRGNVYYMQAEYSTDQDRNYNLALADFNTALRLNPKEVEAYIRRGIVRAQMAKYSGDSQLDYQKAIADFNQAISLNPSRAEAHYQLGLVRYQIAQYSSNFEQEYTKAIADFTRALNINPRLSKVYLKRGIVYHELAQYGGKESRSQQSKAVEDLQMAAKISLEQDDEESYQQALSSICIVVENKCDTMFQNATFSQKAR